VTVGLKIAVPAACFPVILGGGALAAFHFKWLTPGPFPPVVWVLAAAFGIYLAAHLAVRLPRDGWGLRLPAWATGPCALAVGAVFLLALDFWGRGEKEPILVGLPLWAWYFVLLSAVQTALMIGITRRELRGR
jgi:hypothetical protein